jgi:hypothetical protein
VQRLFINCEVFTKSKLTNEQYIAKCNANEADVVKYTEAVEVVKLKLDKLQDDVAACEVSLIPPPPPPPPLPQPYAYLYEHKDRGGKSFKYGRYANLKDAGLENKPSSMEIGPTLERLFMSITISRGICCIRIRQ